MPAQRSCRLALQPVLPPVFYHPLFERRFCLGQVLFW
jgi:hypothetical protein